MWGRVRGDGNCLWRSAGQILDLPWQQVKEAAMAQAPTTKPLWQAFFPSTTEQEWNAQMTAANPNAFANEVSCALLAKAYDRPVAIVGGGGQIFVT